MKVLIEIIKDSENSYPESEVVFEIFKETVYIQISDSEREITVNRAELVKLLEVIK